MAYGPDCPYTVERPLMHHQWNTLTFMHWRCEPAEVQRLLPEGLEAETFDGSAWVGLVPFLMRVRGPAGPWLPWLGNFPETNVRTYVRVQGDAHTKLVWFFSLDAARLAPVVTARCAYRLPYMWSSMRVERTGSDVRYRSTRRLPQGGPFLTADVTVGEPLDHVSELEHFLTARFGLVSPRRGGFRFSAAAHAPWELRRAHVSGLSENLISAAGLSRPSGEPLVHFSEGVTVRIGRPESIR